MRKITFLIIAGILLAPHVSLCQESLVHRSQTWSQLFFNAKITQKTAIHLDGGYRWNEGFDKSLNYLIRPGIVLNFKKFSISGGHAYFYFYKQKNTEVDRPEHRFWQQITKQHTLGKFEISHRIRGEQRYIHKNTQEREYRYYQRWRYQIRAQLPLQKENKKSPAIVCSEEILVNAGSQAPTPFDQNRIYVGFSFWINKYQQIAFGYQNIFQKRPSGTPDEMIHCVRLNINHQFDWTKKEASIP